MKFEVGKTIIGIIGAGTMGAGIALAALYKGFEVTLYDVYPESLEKGRAYIEKFLVKKDLEKNLKLLSVTENLEDFAGSDFVIEAAIENLDLKQELFAKLDEFCPPPAILATNTSTLSVTAIASATETPERVVGMHFFNPAPVLPLVEVVRGSATNEETVNAIIALAEVLGKEPVVTGDTPGFIVNRVARPFYGEALRLLGEGVATVEEIDLLVEQGAGFKMGPFKLMDLIGIDINAGAMQSMYEQTFGEPRYRPHSIQMQKVASGELGRKTGKGFYEYSEETIETEEQKEKKPKKIGEVVIVSEGNWRDKVKRVCEGAGYRVETVVGEEEKVAACFIVAERDEDLQGLVSRYDQEVPYPVPLLVQTEQATVNEMATWARNPQRVGGFDSLFFGNGNAVTLAGGYGMSIVVSSRAQAFVNSLGMRAVWVQDSPALVLPRIVCQLINEAAFAVLEGVAEADVIDQAMQLGVNYPKGLLEWGKEIGYARVLAVLDHLWEEYHEERYRACTLLRRWARQEMISK